MWGSAFAWEATAVGMRDGALGRAATRPAWLVRLHLLGLCLGDAAHDELGARDVPGWGVLAGERVVAAVDLHDLVLVDGCQDAPWIAGFGHPRGVVAVTIQESHRRHERPPGPLRLQSATPRWDARRPDSGARSRYPRATRARPAAAPRCRDLPPRSGGSRCRRDRAC